MPGRLLETGLKLAKGQFEPFAIRQGVVFLHMIDSNEDNGAARSSAERLLQIGKKVIRYHWDSYGKLNDPWTHLISLLVAVGFLLVSYLIFG